ncbi:hypothetical protein L5G32_08150 [Gordonia sp. HY002]|uniref:hypothetical protein n=1 Tax=Gordonia zhenghanii TaxID=2911516 RepID=UPI001EEFEC75|nr:hypothetical protein [Gordonia zhenghanii]MCF8570237.1 hypothetical protein [Gordonia zhenghanii]MCF8607062.1 hypothetical protein [Gordonia zhenghanii]
MTRRAVWGAIGVCAVVIAVVFGVLAVNAHREPAGPDVAPAQAAASAVGKLMTFAPGDRADHRAAVQAALTGALGADYALRGPDVVFPSAVASKVTMTVDVTDAATVEHADRSARVLVFARQTVVVGDHTDSPAQVGVARWAWMTRVESHWLLARLTPVSPQ